MNLIDDLLRQIPEEPAAVREVQVGVHWTAVCSRGCGLASTQSGAGPHGSQRARCVGELHTRPAQELAGWLRSEVPLETSIGLAALNSLLEVDESRAVEVNAFDFLAEQGAGKKIAVVGHFPLVERLKPSAAAVWVLEKQPRPGDFPAEAASELIPQADWVAITAMTLLNHTLEGLLALRRPDAKVMLLGPSTPLTPLLFEYGIDIISGTRIVDEAAALLTIQQGASFPQVRGTRLLTFSKNSFTRQTSSATFG